MFILTYSLFAGHQRWLENFMVSHDSKGTGLPQNRSQMEHIPQQNTSGMMPIPTINIYWY